MSAFVQHCGRYFWNIVSEFYSNDLGTFRGFFSNGRGTFRRFYSNDHGTFRRSYRNFSWNVSGKLQELFVHRFGHMAGIIPVSVILLGSYGNVKKCKGNIAQTGPYAILHGNVCAILTITIIIPQTLHKGGCTCSRGGHAAGNCNIARQCVHNIPGTLHKRVHCNIPRQCFHNVAVILQCNLQPNGNIAMYCNGYATFLQRSVL